MVGAAPEKSTADHRQILRQRTFLGAKLTYGDGAFTTDCVVRDFSVMGARVKVPEGLPIPDQVFLVEMRSGIAYEAKVVWKRHPEIGLEFVHEYGLSEASTPHLRLLKHIWIEHCQRSGI